MYMCGIFTLFSDTILFIPIAIILSNEPYVNCILKNPSYKCLNSTFTFINSNFSTSPRCNLLPPKYRKFIVNNKSDLLSIEPENLPGEVPFNDFKAASDELEKKNVEYIDKLENLPNPSENTDGVESTDNSYFDWESITKSTGSDLSPNGFDEKRNLDEEIRTVTTNLDGKPRDDLEKGERPVIYGSGLNSELKVEDYEIGVSNGRINEWPIEWVPGRKVLSFFPILIDQYSVNPSPLQIGFEDTIRFRGKHVESTFNSVIDKLGDKEIFGLCFLSPESMQLAPLAVYAELISKETVVDGSGENLLVTGRVLGRALINKILLDEPFIKALVSPYEDEPVLHDPDNIPKLVDEISNLYDNCNAVEAEIMQLLEQPYAHTRVKNRRKLMDIIDDRLNKFNIKNTVNQGFAQIAAYCAFDYHMNATERYDALAMQNTEDRLRFVRDTLRFKGKQLGIVKNSPKNRLEELVKHLRDFQNNRDSMYNFTEGEENKEDLNENVTVNSSSNNESS